MPMLERSRVGVNLKIEYISRHNESFMPLQNSDRYCSSISYVTDKVVCVWVIYRDYIL